MEEMKEGFLGKSNQETMTGEESVAGAWGGARLHTGERRGGHSGPAYPAETRTEGKQGIRRSGRAFILRLRDQRCDTGMRALWTTLSAGRRMGRKERP